MQFRRYALVRKTLAHDRGEFDRVAPIAKSRKKNLRHVTPRPNGSNKGRHDRPRGEIDWPLLLGLSRWNRRDAQVVRGAKHRLARAKISSSWFEVAAWVEAWAVVGVAVEDPSKVPSSPWR